MKMKLDVTVYCGLDIFIRSDSEFVKNGELDKGKVKAVFENLREKSLSNGVDPCFCDLDMLQKDKDGNFVFDDLDDGDFPFYCEYEFDLEDVNLNDVENSFSKIYFDFADRSDYGALADFHAEGVEAANGFLVQIMRNYWGVVGLKNVDPTPDGKSFRNFLKENGEESYYEVDFDGDGEYDRLCSDLAMFASNLGLSPAGINTIQALV